MPRKNLSPSFREEIKDKLLGTMPTANNSSISSDNVAWTKFQRMTQELKNAGELFRSNSLAMSTYSLVYTTTQAYAGGVLSLNGDIHFIPLNATVGQKIATANNNLVSTYSLVYTTSNAYRGGVLNPAGEIHFIPFSADRGQKIAANGTVSTYSLTYTTVSGAYDGGVVAPDGVIHMIPRFADRGQKIAADGTVSTYSLVYTASNAYAGGVLNPAGEIHFIPFSADRGQKIAANGTVYTYSLTYTGSAAYSGGVLDLDGTIHFMPLYGTMGQKVTIEGTVSTYSLVRATGDGDYNSGTLMPNGDVVMIPFGDTTAPPIQIIKPDGTVLTYSVLYTSSDYAAYLDGVLTQYGDVIMIPHSAAVGQIIHNNSISKISRAWAMHPFFNKR